MAANNQPDPALDPDLAIMGTIDDNGAPAKNQPRADDGLPGLVRVESGLTDADWAKMLTESGVDPSVEGFGKPTAEKPASAKPDVKPETKPDAKPATAETATPKPETKPEVKPEAKPEVKPAAKPDEKPADKVKDDLDEIPLPKDTKQTTAASFEAAKSKTREARAERDAARKEAEELKARLADVEAKAKAAPPPEVLKEVEDLRKWRASVDINVAPEVKAFDSRTATAENVILSTLKSKMTEEQMKQVKEIGVTNLNWAPILDRLDIKSRAVIATKLGEIESVGVEKQAFIEKAKANLDEYLATRDEHSTTSLKKEAHEMVTAAAEVLREETWFHQKQVPATATEEEKKAIESHNAFAKDAQETFKEALADRSPKMKAICAVGFIKAMQLTNVIRDLEAKVKEAETAREAAQKELTEIEKSASTGAKPSKVAQEEARTTKGSSQEIATGGRLKTAGEALDELYQQAMSTRS